MLDVMQSKSSKNMKHKAKKEKGNTRTIGNRNDGNRLKIEGRKLTSRSEPRRMTTEKMPSVSNGVSCHLYLRE